MTNTSAAIALGLFLSLTLPPSVEAQQTGQAQPEAEANCKTCRHNLDTDEHWFKGNCSSGSLCYDCVAFNACHSGPQAPFSCSLYHWLCGSTSAMLDAMDEAVAAPDAGLAVLRVATSSPTILQVTSTGYVLVKNCDGAIVAAYKVPAVSQFLVRQNVAPLSLTRSRVLQSRT
jgi:hypothetical protein